MTTAARITNTGILLVNGTFDENSSISPSIFRTTSNTIYASTLDEVSLPAGSISLNGTSQYLSVSSNAAYAFGTGDFTIEFWTYPTISSSTAWTPIICIGSNGGGKEIRISQNINGTGYGYLIPNNSNNADVYTGYGTLSLNTWSHLALVKYGSTVTFYKNGVSIGSTASVSFNFSSNSPVQIGYGYYPSDGYYGGYISNLRIVNGTAVYTGAFTPPKAILPVISGTKLLLNSISSANFITDNSQNGGVVTNNGTAVWNANGPFNNGSTNVAQRNLNDGTLEVLNQFDEFTGAPIVDSSLMVWIDAAQTSSYSGSGSSWTDLSGNSKTYTLQNSPTFSSLTNGGVIVFDKASSQYINTAVTLFNSTTYPAYSINLWIYPTNSGTLVAVDGQTTINSGYHYSAIEISAAGIIKFGQWTGGMTTIATSSQSLNAWYNLVITYSSSLATAYINGTSVGTSASTWSAPGTNTFIELMGIDSTNMGTGSYASGKIGAFMVYNRALTADEVTTNFNALRNRYSI
jgi:hypothetical protein